MFFFGDGGLPSRRDKKGKKRQKDWLSDAWVPVHRWLIFSNAHVAGENDLIYLLLREQTLRGLLAGGKPLLFGEAAFAFVKRKIDIDFFPWYNFLE